MEIVKFVIDYLRYIDSRKRSKSGYFLFLILVLVIKLFISPFNQIPLYIRTIAFIIISIISFYFWLYFSGRWVLPTRKLKIGISLKSLDASTQKIIDRTFLLFNDELKKLRFQKQFFIYKIGHDVFNTYEQAEKYADKWDASLVIHGTVYNGNANSKYRYDLRNFSFTYRVYNTPKQTPLWDLVKSDVQLMLLDRDWIIEESNEIIDTNKVSMNLVEILLSILSITLCRSFDHPEISIKLINKVIPYLENHIRPEKKKIEFNKEKNSITMPINLLRSGRLRSILNSCYINTGRIFIKQHKYEEATKTLLEGINKGADKYECYHALALASFYLKGIELAETYTIKMNEIKSNTLDYHLNMAFFSIAKTNYEEVINHYEETRNRVKMQNRFIIEEVIEFLTLRQKENKTEFAYQYAIGILTYNHLNKLEGKKILCNFLKKAKDEKYVPIINKVKFILKIKS